jgi:hypothetical protein
VKGRLNLFQAAMLRWRELHPYNAVHVVRIEHRLDRSRLTAIIEREMAALGLTGFALDAKRRRYAWTGGPAQTELTIHAGGSAPMRTLERAVERALNAPFQAEGRFNPFRYFCIDNGSWFHLGLAYDHVIAGGDSIALLLRGIAARFANDAAATHAAVPLARYPPTYGRLFLRHAWTLMRGVPQLRGMAASSRRSVRPPNPHGQDPRNAFAYCRLDAAEFGALARAAKRWDVTLNDVLLALLLEALAPFAGERDPKHARHELGVASIVNLRRDLGIDPGATFGQFLSSFRISHALPPGIPLEQLARDVRAETAPIKRRKLYLQSLLAVALSSFVWRFLTPERRARFHAKNYPVWGAVSMLDVNALWASAGGPMPPPEYIRAIPTGPLAPLVVAATTAGDVLHLGISYRTAAFSAENIDKMAAHFVASARRLDG